MEVRLLFLLYISSFNTLNINNLYWLEDFKS